MKTAILIFSIRASVLASRLVVTLFITYFIGVEAVGEFGIINGILSIIPVLAGFGLHYQLNREIVHLPVEEALVRIRDRILVTFLISILIVSLLILLNERSSYINITSYTLIVILAMLEIIAFDIHLSLISMRHASFASWLIFFRNSAWVMPFIISAYFFENLRTIQSVLFFWIVGNLSALIALLIFIRAWPVKAMFRKQFDLAWVSARMKTSKLIYASDISMVAALYLDRFVINLQFGLREAGIFVFFWSLSNGIQLLVNTSVIQPALPKLVDVYKNGSAPMFYKAVRRTFLLVIFSSALLITISYTAVETLLPYFGKTELLEYPPLFPCLLAATFLRSLSDLMNYSLYAQEKDRALTTINITSAFTASTFVVIGSTFGGLVGVGVGILINNLCILALRTFFSKGMVSKT